MKTRLSRRSVLRGAAGSLLSLPLLEAMSRKGAMAGPLGSGTSELAAPAKRFVVFFTPNGCIYDRWAPLGQNADFTFIDPAKPTQLRELAPLEEHKSNLLVLSNLSNLSRTRARPGGNEHDKGMGQMLTCSVLVPGPNGAGQFGHLSDGSAAGPSIDQVVATRMAATTRLRSLELGVQSRLDTIRQITTRMSYQGRFQVAPPENDPRQVFKTLVGAGNGADTSGLAALLDRRRSVLDKVNADLMKLLPKISVRDRAKVNSHLTAIRDVERALSDGTVTTCTPPLAPDATLDPLRNENFPAVGKLQMDLLALALACDVTRVASLQWSVAQSPTAHTWLGIPDGHHSLSHEVNDIPGSLEKMVKINNWYAKQYAYLLTKLKALQEDNSTVLDNSIVLWCNEQGNGQNHSLDRIPHVLAGSGGGSFRSGRVVDCGGRATSDLYVSILNALGTTPVQTFGMPEVCKGPLPGLT